MSGHIPNGMVNGMPNGVPNGVPTRAQNAPPTGALQPTWTGYIATTMDALTLFEACMQGIIFHCPRRPHDRERGDVIKSGSVFIYEEHSSGIKRWTDGVPWSPSRILGNFLIYRELSEPFPPGHKKKAQKKKGSENGISKSASHPRATTISMPYLRSLTAQGPLAPTITVEFEKALYGSLIDSYNFKPHGLVKKTISINHRLFSHHLVSYYSAEDVITGKLRVVGEDPRFFGLLPRETIADPILFRAPVTEEELFLPGLPPGYTPTYAVRHLQQLQNPQPPQQAPVITQQRSYSEPQAAVPSYPQPWPVQGDFVNDHQVHQYGHQPTPTQHSYGSGYVQPTPHYAVTQNAHPQVIDHRRHTVFEANGGHRPPYVSSDPARMPVNGQLQYPDGLPNHTTVQKSYEHGDHFEIPTTVATSNGVVATYNQTMATGHRHQHSFDGFPSATSAASGQIIALHEPNVATSSHQQHPSFDEHLPVTTQVSNQTLSIFDPMTTPRQCHQQHASFDPGQAHQQSQPSLEAQFDFTDLQNSNDQGQLEFGVDQHSSGLEQSGIF